LNDLGEDENLGKTEVTHANGLEWLHAVGENPA